MVDHDGDLKIFGHKSRGPLASGCVMYILIHETGTAGFDKMSIAVLQTWMESATDSLRDQTVSFLLQEKSGEHDGPCRAAFPGAMDQVPSRPGNTHIMQPIAHALLSTGHCSRQT